MSKADLMVLIFCIIAALLHGISGFGFPMVSTAAISTLYPLSTTVAFVLLPCLILNLFLLNSDRERSFLQALRYYSGQYWGLIISSLIGSVFGVQLLLHLNDGYLKLLMGLFILWYVLDQFRSQPLRIQASLKNMLLFGLLAGVIGGATNAMAPFLMMYLLSTEHSKTEIVLISNLNFAVSKLIQLLLLYPVMLQFKSEQWSLLGLLTVVSLLGVWAGGQLRAHISQQKFRWLILSLLAVLGGSALWQAVQLLSQNPHFFVV